MYGEPESWGLADGHLGAEYIWRAEKLIGRP